MTKRERKRILRNVRQTYFDILKHKIGARRTTALKGLGMVLATFFNIPRDIGKEYATNNKDVLELYDEIRGTRGIRGDERW